MHNGSTSHIHLCHVLHAGSADYCRLAPSAAPGSLGEIRRSSEGSPAPRGYAVTYMYVSLGLYAIRFDSIPDLSPLASGLGHRARDGGWPPVCCERYGERHHQAH